MLKKSDYIFLIKILFIEILTTAAAMFLFAVILYFLESGYQYSPLFATVSLGMGCFAASYYTARKIGKKGFIIGTAIGGITFLIIALLSLILSNDVFTLNTFFKLIILMLLSFIGGVLGVNSKQNGKYI